MTEPRKRGRPFPKGRSGCPSGRPRGIRDKRHALADALGARSQELLDVAIAKALDGDAPILLGLLGRLIPARKPERSPITLDVPPNARPGEIAEALARAAATGEIAPDAAAEIAAVLGTIARLHEIDALRDRIAEIERAMKGESDGRP
jgi:hypothetical protein